MDADKDPDNQSWREIGTLFYNGKLFNNGTEDYQILFKMPLSPVLEQHVEMWNQRAIVL